MGQSQSSREKNKLIRKKILIDKQRRNDIIPIIDQRFIKNTDGSFQFENPFCTGDDKDYKNLIMKSIKNTLLIDERMRLANNKDTVKALNVVYDFCEKNDIDIDI